MQGHSTTPRASLFQYADETVTVKRLDSGYYHLRGIGPCNWAQPPTWPCAEDVLEASFFEEAGEPFREAVRMENFRLKDEADSRAAAAEIEAWNG